MTLSDERDGGGAKSVYGDLFALVAAAMYGAYTVVMVKRMPHEESASHS